MSPFKEFFWVFSRHLSLLGASNHWFAIIIGQLSSHTHQKSRQEGLKLKFYSCFPGIDTSFLGIDISYLGSHRKTDNRRRHLIIGIKKQVL